MPGNSELFELYFLDVDPRSKQYINLNVWIIALVPP